MESSGCPVHTQGHPLESPTALVLLWRGNLLCETQIHYCCLKALVAPAAPRVVLPFGSQKINFYFLSQLQSRLSSSAGDTQDKSSCAEGWFPVLCQTPECLESAPSLCSPAIKPQELAGTLPWDKVRALSCADPTAIILPRLSVVSLAAGLCQKHVLHLPPGMSSDSDIECDTENEEQEDATSPSEVFNQAFSVQPSSEGRADKTCLPKHSQSSLDADPLGGAVEVFKLQVPVRFGTLP